MSLILTGRATFGVGAEIRDRHVFRHDGGTAAKKGKLLTVPVFPFAVWPAPPVPSSNDYLHRSSWKHDKRSITIEIANVGPQQQDPANANQLNWWPPDNKFQTKWCTKAETAKYVGAPYHGFQFFASYPAAQIAAVSKLVADICA